MPRKKKTETGAETKIEAAVAATEEKKAEKAEKIEKAEEAKAEAKVEAKAEDKMQTFEELRAKIEDTSREAGEAEKHKKKEIKMLSEKELKKIMTDTKETLVPLTDYIRCSVHLGTKVITPDMRKYVYKRRADGLAVINTNLIDDKLRQAIKLFEQYNPEDVFIACKRESGWFAVEKFSEVTGIRKFTKKYPAGIITNLNLDDFFEAKLVLICDPWVDKNALSDANLLKLPVIAICDTNNYTAGVTQKIVANNKAGKSIGLILYVLAREYLKAKGKAKEAKALKMEDFTGKLEEVTLE